MERLGKPRHGREGRRVSEQEVSESNPGGVIIRVSTGSFGGSLRMTVRFRVL